MREFSGATLPEQAFAANSEAMTKVKRCKFLSNITRFVRVTEAHFARETKVDNMPTTGEKSRKNNPPLYNQQNTTFVDDIAELTCCLLLLLCRKKWILSTLDRTRYQAAQKSSLPSSFSLHGVPCHPSIPAVSVTSSRLTLMAPPNQSGFEKL